MAETINKIIIEYGGQEYRQRAEVPCCHSWDTAESDVGCAWQRDQLLGGVEHGLECYLIIH